MGISADTLFHFTNSKENLLSILKNNFWAQYSFNGIGSKYKLKDDRPILMISFCDIPLSQIKGHSSIYGEYAIGLSKEWGLANKVSPVLYYYENGSLWDGMREMVKYLDSIERNRDQMIDGANIITAYRKLYEGYIIRNNKFKEDKVKFYDEREWRYVPPISELKSNNTAMMLDDLKGDLILLMNYQESVKGKYRLKFSPKDVKYIIVKNDSEILELSKSLEDIKSGYYSAEDIRLLISRLISIKQVFEDF